MRIAHLLSESPWGNGAAHMAVDLACEQARSGHDVLYLSARSEFDELLVRHGVRVATVPTMTPDRSLLRTALVVRRITRRFGADVLHAHMRSSAVVGAMVAAAGRADLVTTVHNSYDAHWRLMGLGRRVVAVSQAERELLLQRGFRPRKVDMVLNGTGGSPRSAPASGDGGTEATRTPSIAAVAGLHPRKAVDDVISAFAMVAGQFPGWHLDVVGDGADRRALEAQAGRLQVARAVRFHGAIRDPMPLLRRSAIFMTATLADPCPLAVIEARTAGCALIGTAVGGVPEILDHGRAGLLVAPRDPAALAGALRRLTQDPQSLRAWQRSAAEGADGFSTARMSRQYDDVYRSVLAGRRRPRPGTDGGDRTP